MLCNEWISASKTEQKGSADVFFDEEVPEFSGCSYNDRRQVGFINTFARPSIVSNIQSKNFLKRVKSAFKKGTDLPVESLSAFPLVPGIDFSDHGSFWKFRYDAVMVTDTAFYRNPQYHGIGDIPEILDYERMAKVVLGLKSSVEELAVCSE